MRGIVIFVCIFIENSAWFRIMNYVSYMSIIINCYWRNIFMEKYDICF